MALVRSVVIGRTMGDQETSNCGDMGIESPWEVFAFTVHDIAFFNYDQTNRAVVTSLRTLFKTFSFCLCRSGEFFLKTIIKKLDKMVKERLNESNFANSEKNSE